MSIILHFSCFLLFLIDNIDCSKNISLFLLPYKKQSETKQESKFYKAENRFQLSLCSTADKRSRHLGSDGIYLDDITDLEPEVVALYFPKRYVETQS